MKVVILAGGFGTRIIEESHLVPKPMIEIENLPILLHIMKYYSSFGYFDFIILAGYKQKIIKDYFSNYFLYSSDVTFDYSEESKRTYHSSISEKWKVTIVDTGLETMTGGRLLNARHYIGDNDFHLTYGDGLSDVDLEKLCYLHNNSNNIATLTGVKDIARFGNLEIKNNKVVKFKEKEVFDSAWINGGFMILRKEVFDYIIDGQTNLEKDVLKDLSSKEKLGVYKHYGFWQCMDTLRDKIYLENLLKTNSAPWIKK